MCIRDSTYTEGSTSGGLVIYDDKFGFSHHGTDPASGILCNAFDLVRIHKFGELDQDAKDDTPANRLPSFTKMNEFASNNSKVMETVGKEMCIRDRNNGLCLESSFLLKQLEHFF